MEYQPDEMILRICQDMDINTLHSFIKSYDRATYICMSELRKRISKDIVNQGSIVRGLKQNKAPFNEVKDAVEYLKMLNAKYIEIFGKQFTR